ncbi:MAG: hypothetical protein R2851_11900 [Caldilineaceae bacterium]
MALPVTQRILQAYFTEISPRQEVIDAVQARCRIQSRRQNPWPATHTPPTTGGSRHSRAIPRCAPAERGDEQSDNVMLTKLANLLDDVTEQTMWRNRQTM